MPDPEVYEEAAVPAANSRRVVATGNRASAQRAATQPGRKVAREGGCGAVGTPASRPQAPAHPRPAVPSGLDRSCAARRAKGLLGWGCRCLWSVKLLAPSAKATWQLGLEAPAHSVRRKAGPQAARGTACTFPARVRPTRPRGSPAAPGQLRARTRLAFTLGPLFRRAGSSRSGAVRDTLEDSAGAGSRLRHRRRPRAFPPRAPAWLPAAGPTALPASR